LDGLSHVIQFNEFEIFVPNIGHFFSIESLVGGQVFHSMGFEFLRGHPEVITLFDI
jgi:hypothetical protein